MATYKEVVEVVGPEAELWIGAAVLTRRAVRNGDFVKNSALGLNRWNWFDLPLVVLFERVQLDLVGKELHAKDGVDVVVARHDAKERSQAPDDVDARAEDGVHDLDTRRQIDEAKDEQHVHDPRYSPDRRVFVQRVSLPATSKPAFIAQDAFL